MSYSSSAASIRSAIKAGLSASYTIVYDNSFPVDATDLKVPDPPHDATWLRASVKFGDSTQADCGAVGSRRFRTFGIVQIQIFAPANIGDATTLTAMDAIKAIFRATTISGIIFRTPLIDPIGRDGPWWQTNVNCPFFVDDFA